MRSLASALLATLKKLCPSFLVAETDVQSANREEVRVRPRRANALPCAAAAVAQKQADAERTRWRRAD
jgi:hypothetical protein